MLRGPDGRVWMPVPSNVAYGRDHDAGVGSVAPDVARGAMARVARSSGPIADVLSEMFTIIPQWYTVSIELGSDDGAQASNSAPLRPEPFVCSRITWATTGDCPKFLVSPDDTPAVLVSGSAQGRCVEASWEDEFTKFLGNRPCLLAALFGDSNGYLDIPKGVLLVGKQTLSVTLRRITWPTEEGQATTRFDISFQGLGLLPKGVNQSGSAG